MRVHLKGKSYVHPCESHGFKVIGCETEGYYIDVVENPLDPTGRFRHVPADAIKEITMRYKRKGTFEKVIASGLYVTGGAEVWFGPQKDLSMSILRKDNWEQSIHARADTLHALCELLAQIDKGELSPISERERRVQKMVADLGRGCQL